MIPTLVEHRCRTLTKRTMPGRSKIDIADTKQVKYWTKALDVSKDDLFEAIDKVGNAAATVRKELQRKGLSMPEDDKPLKPEDFPVNSEGKKIKKAGWHPDCGVYRPRYSC